MERAHRTGSMAWLCSPESSDQCHNVIRSEPRQTGPGCQVKNLVATRMSNPEEDQAFSSWTGFNILIRNDKLVVRDIAGYLPTINAPATTVSRVNEVLTQPLNIAYHTILNLIYRPSGRGFRMLASSTCLWGLA